MKRLTSRSALHVNRLSRQQAAILTELAGGPLTGCELQRRLRNGAKATRAGSASVSRSLRRLCDRGLLDLWRGQRFTVGWPRIELTEMGRRACEPTQ